MRHCRLFRWLRVAAGVAFLLGTIDRALASDAEYQVVVSPANSVQYSIRNTHGPLLEVGLAAWGTKWKYIDQPLSHEKGKGEQLMLDTPLAFAEGEVMKIHLEASPTTKNSVSYSYTLSAASDVGTTCVVVTMAIPDPVDASSVHSMTVTAGGKDTDLTFPGNRLDGVPSASKVVFHAADGDIQVSIDPPATIDFQRTGIRLVLAQDTFKAGTSTTKVTYTFAQPAAYLASEEALAQFAQTVAGKDWFPWIANDHASPSVFAMDDWLDKPAGKHGGVRMEGDHFQFEDGTRIKFWGTNLAYALCAPEHAAAVDTATRFARYGINAVRLHKFTGPDWQGFGDPNDVTQFDAKGLEKFDYFTSQLKEHGIYYGFSHTFGMQVRPGNKGQLLAYDEIVNNLKGSTLGLINYSEDIQDLLIQSVVNLLGHTNPYSGKTYAEDPCLNYIELQNEDDIFWYQTGSTYAKCPTYAKKLRERFADWLTKRYTTQEAVAQAWPGALKAGETLADKSIDVQMIAYDLTEGPLAAQTPGGRQRKLDTAAFLHDVQDQFYSKFVKAIRGTGYKGPLCGSPWQAPAMVPEYYNLLSDSEVGYIDRHNYFGEDDVFATMLSKPGSGYLSTGLQQVDNRPFGVSEWISQFPIQYQADGPVIMAAYGLGLQGWDSSYEFNSSIGYPDGSWFAPNAGGLPFRRWFVDSPVQLGQFPALARMISRGDVKEGEVISVRKTSLDEISHDHFSFTDVATQQGDVKTFGGSCPPEALAAGRCLVQFTDSAQPSVEPDMTKYQNGSVITSTTGELVWNSAENGFITINTAGTKAVVGFASGKAQKLGNVTITSRTSYASIILTALDQHATLDDAKSALLTMVARAVSTGFTVNTLNNHMLAPGTAPLLVEPVQADIAIAGREIAAVNVLNQNGALTQKTIPVHDGAFHIDSAEDQTLYYQVVFK